MIHDAKLVDELVQFLPRVHKRLPVWQVFQTDQPLQFRSAVHWMVKSDASPLPPEYRHPVVIEWRHEDGFGNLDNALILTAEDGSEWYAGHIRYRKARTPKEH